MSRFILTISLAIAFQSAQAEIHNDVEWSQAGELRASIRLGEESLLESQLKQLESDRLVMAAQRPQQCRSYWTVQRPALYQQLNVLSQSSDPRASFEIQRVESAIQSVNAQADSSDSSC